MAKTATLDRSYFQQYGIPAGLRRTRPLHLGTSLRVNTPEQTARLNKAARAGAISRMTAPEKHAAIMKWKEANAQKWRDRKAAGVKSPEALSTGSVVASIKKPNISSVPSKIFVGYDKNGNPGKVDLPSNTSVVKETSKVAPVVVKKQSVSEPTGGMYKAGKAIRGNLGEFVGKPIATAAIGTGKFLGGGVIEWAKSIRRAKKDAGEFTRGLFLGK